MKGDKREMRKKDSRGGLQENFRDEEGRRKRDQK